MAMTTGSNAGQSYSEINMTPLIDVMLGVADHFHHYTSEPDARHQN